jgi:molybdate transport system ATP-binding protein
VSGSAVDDVLSVELHHRLRRVDLDVRFSLGWETLALVGPSGAGKTSVLRTIAGLLRPDHGRIAQGRRVLVDTERGIALPPEDRAVGMMFQEGALFPHLSIGRNVAYGLRPRPRSAKERRQRVAALLERFGVASLAAARPAEVSGGERQRAALARAVATTPRVLLLDEPLSALDSVTKASVARELSQWLAELRLPTILVSHDYNDVVGLADRVAVMEAGAVVQTGTMDELARSPASPFVAAFTRGNLFVGAAVRRGDSTEIRGQCGASFLSRALASGRVGVVVDPWAVRLSRATDGATGPNALVGPVVQIARLGATARVTVGSVPPVVAEVELSHLEELSLARGAIVVAEWEPESARLVPLPNSLESSR